MDASTAMLEMLPLFRRSILLASVCAVVAACSGAAVDALPTPAASQLFYALRLDQHAITLSTIAPYDTATIHVVALDGNALPLETQPVMTVVGGDSAVRVTPLSAGRFLLTGRAMASRVILLATATTRNTKRTDTAYVTVTEVSSPPRVASCSIHSGPGDSAVFNPSFFSVLGQLPLAIRDSSGSAVDSIDVSYASSDTLVAKVDRQFGSFFSMLPGFVTMSVSATIYGVRCADSVQYTIGPPGYAFVTVNEQTVVSTTDTIRTFSPDTVIISAGGWVAWGAGVHDSLDVHFPNPSLVTENPDFPSGGGDIPLFVNDTTVDFFTNHRFRVFTQPGTYTYHSSRFPATGTVIVK